MSFQNCSVGPIRGLGTLEIHYWALLLRMGLAPLPYRFSGSRSARVRRELKVAGNLSSGDPGNSLPTPQIPASISHSRRVVAGCSRRCRCAVSDQEKIERPSGRAGENRSPDFAERRAFADQLVRNRERKYAFGAFHDHATPTTKISFWPLARIAFSPGRYITSSKIG